MKLSIEKLAAECPNYSDCISINLDCKRLSKIPAISRCRQLQYLSLRCNQLTSIDEISLCSKLWAIDLLQNTLSDISPLSTFQVLGYLCLNCNNISQKSLTPLQSVHIICLDCSSPQLTRLEVIQSLPHIWILNDVYIADSERPVTPQHKKMIAFGNSQASEYAKKFSNSMTEKQKFEHLIYELEKLCELEWEVKNNKGKNSKFPKFQLCRWKDIKATSKLVLASVFFLYLEGFYPCSVVKEVVAIVVTESYPENTPLIEAIELCELKPHYLLSFVLFLMGFADTNPLWKSLDADYLIRNFQSVQKNWEKNEEIISIVSEPMTEQIKIVENRQKIALFVLTVLIKFEIVNQLLANKPKISKNGSLEVLQNLLDYGKVDEATLLYNLSDRTSKKPAKTDIRNSILSYSRSLQNLKISENNSSRYGSFLVKTKGTSKNLMREESEMFNKFEELHTLKKQGSRVLSSEKHSREMLPPIIPSAKYSNISVGNSSKDSVSSKLEYLPIQSSQIFSTDNQDKTEFMLASSSFVKRKKQWRSIQAAPVVYSLSDSQTSFKPQISQKSLNLTQKLDRYMPTYYYEEVLKVSISPSEDPEKQIDFRIEYLTDKTFLTRVEINEPEKIVEADQDPIIKFRTINKEPTGSKKWYPVPKRVRFIVDDNFVQNLKPCNFYEEHKELLPPIPERVYKKPSLILQGKHAEPCKVSKEIIKDQDHLIRVISREKTPWVGYQLKPTTKIRHDVFCANYGVLLVSPI